MRLLLLPISALANGCYWTKIVVEDGTRTCTKDSGTRCVGGAAAGTTTPDCDRPRPMR